MEPIHARDFDQLFRYFVGAKAEHAIHVRALLHAGFIVEGDPDTTRKSSVFNPVSNEKIGVILGEPTAVIGLFKPESIKPEPTPPATVNGKVEEKRAGTRYSGSGV